MDQKFLIHNLGLTKQTHTFFIDFERQTIKMINYLIIDNEDYA